MKRIGIIVLSIISLICGVSNAESVSRKDAQRFASAFFNEANGMVMAQPKEVVFGRGLTTDRLFTPFYIFNHPKGGFVIISAENKTFPILAFSLTDKFDSSKIDPAIQAILTTYARDIENIRYDSSIPTQAIESWTDYSGYIDDILKSIKGTHEYEKVFFKENVQTLIDSIADLEDNYRFSCELFSPDQWKEIVFGEIKEKGSLPLGFRNIKGNFIGVLGKGFSGDYLMI